MRKLAPMLCAAALTLSLAVPAGAYYASNEDGSNEPGGPITSVSVTTEPVAEPTLPSLGGLTPDGNLALIDDILGGAYYSSEEVGDSQMQFVTVESKNGNTFYLVIDHATGDVYFLNLVDEADLLALLEDEGYEVECDCADALPAGRGGHELPRLPHRPQRVRRRRNRSRRPSRLTAPNSEHEAARGQRQRLQRRRAAAHRAHRRPRRWRRVLRPHVSASASPTPAGSNRPRRLRLPRGR